MEKRKKLRALHGHNISCVLHVTSGALGSMVHYELAVIFSALSKPQLNTALRGACTTLLGQGSVVRSMENRGERRLPYKMGAHKERFTHGRYVRFVFVE